MKVGIASGKLALILLIFQPTHLEVECESRLHNVPAGVEAHFRVQVVSDKFEGLSQLQVSVFVIQSMMRL